MISVDGIRATGLYLLEILKRERRSPTATSIMTSQKPKDPHSRGIAILH